MNTQRTSRKHRAESVLEPTGRAAQATRRREELLAIAQRLFVQNGYAASSTKRIAEAANVAEGLLFHYFGTKDALLLAVMSRESSFAGTVGALLLGDETGTARELLESIASAYAAVTAEEAAFVAFASAEALVNPAIRGAVTLGTERMVARMIELLRRRVETGELRPQQLGVLLYLSRH